MKTTTKYLSLSEDKQDKEERITGKKIGTSCVHRLVFFLYNCSKVIEIREHITLLQNLHSIQQGKSIHDKTKQ